MIVWIRRFARLAGLGTFFMLLLLGLDMRDPFDPATAYAALIKGIAGGMLVWVVSFVLGDIIFKGVVEDIHEEPDDDLEGGLLQQVRTARSALVVTVAEQPPEQQPDEKKKNKRKKK